MTPPLQALATRPTAPTMTRATLRGFERLAVPACSWLNTSRRAKHVVQWAVRQASARWVHFLTGPRLDLHGFDAIRALKPPSSVLLVSNHRSFFDMYIASALLYQRTDVLDCIYFPVRSRFFYDNPLGMALNLAISGGAMWPPVFQDERRRELNPIGSQQLIHLLQERGNAVGIHPEGTRGRGPDPHDLLPSRPGVGRLVAGAPDDMLVLPFFIIGPSDSLALEVRRRFTSGAPNIRMRWAPPVFARDLKRLGDDLAITQHLHGTLQELAQADADRT